MLAAIQNSTLVVSDLTAQDVSILNSLLSPKGVGKIETALSNIIREVAVTQVERDTHLILDAVMGLSDDQRQAIVDIVTGKTDVSSTRVSL